MLHIKDGINVADPANATPVPMGQGEMDFAPILGPPGGTSTTTSTSRTRRSATRRSIRSPARRRGSTISTASGTEPLSRGAGPALVESARLLLQAECRNSGNFCLTSSRSVGLPWRNERRVRAAHAGPSDRCAAGRVPAERGRRARRLARQPSRSPRPSPKPASPDSVRTWPSSRSAATDGPQFRAVHTRGLSGVARRRSRPSPADGGGFIAKVGRSREPLFLPSVAEHGRPRPRMMRRRCSPAARSSGCRSLVRAAASASSCSAGRMPARSRTTSAGSSPC